MSRTEPDRISSGYFAMTLNLTLTEEEMHSLQEMAKEMGMTPVEVVKKTLSQLLIPRKLSFEEAKDRVLKKNAELYRRLS